MSKETKKETKQTEKDWCVVVGDVFRQDAFKKEVANKIAEWKENGWIKVEKSDDVTVNGNHLIAHLKFYRMV